jgi:hypothetical protein
MEQDLIVVMQKQGKQFAYAYFHTDDNVLSSRETLDRIAKNYAMYAAKGQTEEEASINALYGMGAGIVEKSPCRSLARLSKNLEYRPGAEKDSGRIALTKAQRAKLLSLSNTVIWFDADGKNVVISTTSNVFSNKLAGCKEEDNGITQVADWLNLSEEAVVRLSDAHYEYVSKKASVEEICKKFGDIVPIYEKISDILPLPGLTVVKDGAVVNSAANLSNAGAPKEFYVLNEGKYIWREDQVLS